MYLYQLFIYYNEYVKNNFINIKILKYKVDTKNNI